MKAIIEDEGERARMHVRYETDGFLTAREIGAVVDRLTLSLEHYDKNRPPGTHYFTLALEGIRVGSILADLVAITSGIRDVYDAREVLAGFVTHLNSILSAIVARGPRAVNATDRITMETLAKPICDGDATAISITVNGSNNTIVFGRDEAKAILDRKTAASNAAAVTGFETDSASPVLSSGDGYRHGEYGHGGYGEDYGDGYGGATPEATKLELPSRLTAATLHYVEGQWFARPAGLRGVLVPADVGDWNPIKIVEDGRPVEGHIISSGDQPVEYRMVRVTGPSLPA